MTKTPQDLSILKLTLISSFQQDPMWGFIFGSLRDPFYLIPFTIHVGAAAAGYVLQLALATAVSLDDPSVADALRTIDVELFYGPVKIDSYGRNHAKPMYVTQVSIQCVFWTTACTYSTMLTATSSPDQLTTKQLRRDEVSEKREMTVME